jgi:hypothetical protein
MQQHTASFPIKTKAFSMDVNQKKTDFMIQEFSDTVFVVITQIGKPGTIVSEKT